MKQTIYGLNSLRFLCFIAIFVNHATSWFHFGFFAIDFFFALSGFLITLLALQEIEATGKLNKWNFFIRRILKIWPLYIATLIFSFFILPLVSKKMGFVVTLPDNQLYYWLFISNFENGAYHFALKQLWTVAVEEQFYILFIFLSLFIKNHFWNVLFILLTTWICTVLYSYFDSSISLYANSFYNFICFSMGMAAAKIVFTKSCPTLQVVSISVFSILATILFFNFETLQVYMKIPFSIFCSSILVLIYSKQNWLRKKKQIFTFTEYLGKYTYGLYIYSAFVISIGNFFFKFENNLILFFSELIITIIIAILSFELFEKRFLSLKKYFRK